MKGPEKFRRIREHGFLPHCFFACSCLGDFCGPWADHEVWTCQAFSAHDVLEKPPFGPGPPGRESCRRYMRRGASNYAGLDFLPIFGLVSRGLGEILHLVGYFGRSCRESARYCGSIGSESPMHFKLPAVDRHGGVPCSRSAPKVRWPSGQQVGGRCANLWTNELLWAKLKGRSFPKPATTDKLTKLTSSQPINGCLSCLPHCIQSCPACRRGHGKHPRYT